MGDTTTSSTAQANATRGPANGSPPAGPERSAAQSLQRNTDRLGRVDVQGLVNDVKHSSPDVQTQRDNAAAAAKQIEDRGVRQEFVKALEDQGVARKPGFFERQWQGLKGTATGVYEGGASLVGGVYELGKLGVQGTVATAKFGYNYATDGQYRGQTNAAVGQAAQTAVNATGQGLSAARDYAADRIANPDKLAQDAKVVESAVRTGADVVARKADQIYDSYDKARSEAVIQGTTDELGGKIVGRAAFEVASLAVPVTKLGVVGKGAALAADAEKVVKGAEVTVEASRVVRATEATVDASKAAQGVGVTADANKVVRGAETLTDANRAAQGSDLANAADRALVRSGGDPARAARVEQETRASTNAVRQTAAAETKADVVAKFRGEPLAFGSGARSLRAEAMVSEAAKASNISDVKKYVDVVRYQAGSSSYFTVEAGQRVLAIGSAAFGKTKAGQLIEAAHELAHAQMFDKFVQKLGRAAAEAEYFAPHRNFGTALYAREEQVVERLARMRVRDHLGGLTPQQEAYSTKYIDSWKAVVRGAP
jgi:hypothetical protein